MRRRQTFEPFFRRLLYTFLEPQSGALPAARTLPNLTELTHDSRYFLRRSRCVPDPYTRPKDVYRIDGAVPEGARYSLLDIVLCVEPGLGANAAVY